MSYLAFRLLNKEGKRKQNERKTKAKRKQNEPQNGSHKFSTKKLQANFRAMTRPNTDFCISEEGQLTENRCETEK